MEDSLRDIYDKAREKYWVLEDIDPENELLRYFRINRNWGFVLNQQAFLGSEDINNFVRRFGGLVDKTKVRKFSEYKNVVLRLHLANYSNALERAIKEIQKEKKESSVRERH